MGKVIGILSIKGGVGKTTICASLASDLVNHYQKSVLVIDANYSAPNLGLHVDIVAPEKTIHDVLAGKARIESAIHQRYGIDVVPGKYTLRSDINYLKLHDKLARIKNLYDFVLIDSSPSLNEEILSAMLASDHLYLVTTPDYPTLSCSIRAAQFAKQRDKPIAGLMINRIRDPRYELNLHDIESSLGIPVVACFPEEKLHIRALFSRIPLPLYKKKSAFSREISKLSAALAGKEEKRVWWKKLLSTHVSPEEVNRQLLKKDFYTSTFEHIHE